MDFTITFDYLCPFARNANEAAVAGVREGRQWRPRYAPFSLSQVHLEPGEQPVWSRPDDGLPSGVPALLWGLAVREASPDRFPEAHLRLFAVRHDRGDDLGDRRVLREAVAAAGVDADQIAAAVAAGGPRRILADEHTSLAERHGVFGVPTVITGDEAVFIRLMERGDPDDLARVLDLVSWTDLNELKRTRIPR